MDTIVNNLTELFLAITRRFDDLISVILGDLDITFEDRV